MATGQIVAIKDQKGSFPGLFQTLLAHDFHPRGVVSTLFNPIAAFAELTGTVLPQTVTPKPNFREKSRRKDSELVKPTGCEAALGVLPGLRG